MQGIQFKGGEGFDSGGGGLRGNVGGATTEQLDELAMKFDILYRQFQDLQVRTRCHHIVLSHMSSMC